MSTTPDAKTILSFLPIIDWIIDFFQRTPDQRRERELRRARRRWEKGKIDTPTYEKLKEDIEKAYHVDEMVGSRDFKVDLRHEETGALLLLPTGKEEERPALYYEQSAAKPAGAYSFGVPVPEEAGPLKPIEIPGFNVVMGKDQPQYKPLPAYKDANGVVVTGWHIDDANLNNIVNDRVVYLTQVTGNKPLQPVLLTTENPIQYEEEN